MSRRAIDASAPRRRDGGKPYYHLVLLARDRRATRISSSSPRSPTRRASTPSPASTASCSRNTRRDRRLIRLHRRRDRARTCSPTSRSGARRRAWYADVFRTATTSRCRRTTPEGQAKLNARVFQLAASWHAGDRDQRRALLARDDHDAHDVLLCIGLGKDSHDTNRMRYDDGLYFKSAPGDRRSAFPAARTFSRTRSGSPTRTASRSRRSTTFPSFPLPSGVETENELLVRLAEEGARKRYGDPLPAERARAPRLRARRHHQDRIRRLLPDLADFIKAAREHGIPVGSGPRLGRRLARRVRAAHHRRLSAQVRPAVRALPESRARLDARHRRRLLLRAPRRGDRVRAPEVRHANRSGRSSRSAR